jgi:L-alanine-DL-glutamate epimerase-like enolase superfamily enzyme
MDLLLDNIDRSIDAGIGGIKIKVGQPDWRADIRRLEAVQKRLDGRAALMIDANQQWDRATALRMGRAMESFGLTWIEEPLDAYDAEGHAALAAALDTPIASGEMLTSAAEHLELMRLNAVDILQPDAPRVGGISQFLRIAAFADQKGLGLAPHFSMEIHLHLAATYSREPWIEHFDWLDPLFNEKQEIRDGRMVLTNRPGLGVTLSDKCRAWTQACKTFSRGSA